MTNDQEKRVSVITTKGAESLTTANKGRLLSLLLFHALTYGIDEQDLAGVLAVHGHQLAHEYLVGAPLVFYLEPQSQGVSHLVFRVSSILKAALTFKVT